MRYIRYVYVFRTINYDRYDRLSLRANHFPLFAGYMAPELYTCMKKRARYDSKAVDIYAMGVCLFEMLNLSQPYPADAEDSTVQKIIRQDMRYLEEVSRPCRDLIAAMLRFDPGQR